MPVRVPLSVESSDAEVPMSRKVAWEALLHRKHHPPVSLSLLPMTRRQLVLVPQSS